MAYLGNKPVSSENNSFRVIDDISSYTPNFDGSSAAVVSTADDTITISNHKFITGQRVTYTTPGGSIGGLSSGTVYFIIKNGRNTIKLATTSGHAINGTAIDLSSLGTGTDHTISLVFDSVNTKFRLTYDNGTQNAGVTRAPQLTVSVNGVIQQPQNTSTPSDGYGIQSGDTIVFATAPASTDVIWINLFANNSPTFDVSDNTTDNFTGNGTDSNFSLSKIPANSQNVLVTLDGVVQYPSDADTTRSYQVNGNVLSFVSAPGNGVEIQARHIGFAGATSSAVTGVFGRTGNIGFVETDPIVAIQSGGVAIGTVRTLNFVGTGNSVLLNGNTVDIQITGGGGGSTGAGGTWATYNAGIATNKSVGVNTSNLDDPDLVGVGNSFQGVYVSNGMIVFDNTLHGSHYIGTNFTGLIAGPANIANTLTIDGTYVVV